MGPSIRLLQATRCFTATSASLHVLNLRCSVSLLIVLHHVSLGSPLRRFPLGAHVSATLGFWFEDILSPWRSYFHLLALTCSPIVHVSDLSLTSSLLPGLHRPVKVSRFSTSICARKRLAWIRPLIRQWLALRKCKGYPYRQPYTVLWLSPILPFRHFVF